MSDPTKAVFLSYASQDAEAAKRICDALRSGGVEVWFDADGGLEHGDEWDAKIRRQIKECVLAEITGMNSTHSLICRRIFASHSSPCSSPPSASNHTSTPPLRNASQMRFAASASCEA